MKALPLISLLFLSLSLAAQDAIQTAPRHEFSFLLGMAKHSGAPAERFCNAFWCDEQVTQGDGHAVSTGLAYHYLFPAGPIWVGGGGSFELMGNTRYERLASLTGVVEYRTGQRRVRPVLRLEAGAALPIGAGRRSIYDRSVGPLLHPSVGLLVATGAQRGHEILVTAGYRFTDAGFFTVNWLGQPVEREINYRRLTLTLASRF